MITDKNTLKNWFKKGLKPLEIHFHNWIDSFWHKEENIPSAKIEGLQDLLNQKVDKKVTPSASVYNPAIPYIFDAQNQIYVSYINETSQVDQFKIEGFYRLKETAEIGQSPETNPAKWIYQGQTIGDIQVGDIAGLTEKINTQNTNIANNLQTINEHANNKNIHVDAALLQAIADNTTAINEHAADNAIHVTQSLLDAISNSDTALAEGLISVNDALNTHKDDSTKHVTQELLNSVTANAQNITNTNQSLTNHVNDSDKHVELAAQTDVELAATATDLATINNKKQVTSKGLRWFWDKVKTTITTGGITELDKVAGVIANGATFNSLKTALEAGTNILVMEGFTEATANLTVTLAANKTYKIVGKNKCVVDCNGLTITGATGTTLLFENIELRNVKFSTIRNIVFTDSILDVSMNTVTAFATAINFVYAFRCSLKFSVLHTITTSLFYTEYCDIVQGGMFTNGYLYNTKVTGSVGGEICLIGCDGADFTSATGYYIKAQGNQYFTDGAGKGVFKNLNFAKVQYFGTSGYYYRFENCDLAELAPSAGVSLTIELIGGRVTKLGTTSSNKIIASGVWFQYNGAGSDAQFPIPANSSSFYKCSFGNTNSTTAFFDSNWAVTFISCKFGKDFTVGNIVSGFRAIDCETWAGVKLPDRLTSGKSFFGSDLIYEARKGCAVLESASDGTVQEADTWIITDPSFAPTPQIYIDIKDNSIITVPAKFDVVGFAVEADDSFGGNFSVGTADGLSDIIAQVALPALNGIIHPIFNKPSGFPNKANLNLYVNIDNNNAGVRIHLILQRKLI